MQLSVSQLETYRKCPQAWWLQKRERVPQRKAGWFIQGTAVHAACEAYEDSGRDMSFAQADDIFCNIWREEMTKARDEAPEDRLWMQGGRKTREQDWNERFGLGRQQVNDYISGNLKNGRFQPIEIADEIRTIETGFLIRVDDDLTVLGYIDSILEDQETGDLIVRDIKTGTKTPDTPYQMATYKIAVKEVLGLDIAYGEWWMCRKGGPSKPFDMTQYTKEVVEGWYKDMKLAIENEQFEATQDGCFVCTVAPSCPFRK